MTKLWYLLPACILCSCQIQDAKPLEVSPSENSESTTEQMAVVDESRDEPKVISCSPDTSTLDLSADPCNVIAWQDYLSDIPTMDAQQPPPSAATNPDTNELRTLLLNSRPELPLEQRVDNQILLFDKAATLPNPLGNLIFMYASQNQRLLEQELKIKELTDQNQQQQKQMKQLQNKLAQTQKKIEALTEIEQQLNDVESNPKEGTESE